MKKQEFAVRLLFWLLPWPISKALPRALRIYYFGPAGGPPPGFYNYWGQPGEFWPDMYTPPDPEDFPEPPAGPSNPSDPYTPGPGGGNPSHPANPAGWSIYLDDSYWEGNPEVTWNIDHWDLIGDFSIELGVTGTWAADFRPTKFRITHDYGPGFILGVYIDSPSGSVWWGVCVSGQEYDIDWGAVVEGDIRLLAHDAGEEGCNFNITNIEFFS